MSFRQNEKMFFLLNTFCCFCCVFSLFFFLVYEFDLLLICFIIFLFILIYNYKDFDEYITINDYGIVCCKKNEKIWQHSWDEIGDLRIGLHYSQKSIEIFLKSTKEDDKLEYSLNYFQYGKGAKKALAIYYPKEIKKLKHGLVNGKFID